MTTGELVVFPSNRALLLRAHGMAETTLRRHLGALVQAGIIPRRDSPNEKQYAIRGGEGVEDAYGFALSPVLARSEQFERLAARAAADRRSFALSRGRVTIYRRDIVAMIEAITVAGGDCRDYRNRFAGFCYRPPRRATLASVATPSDPFGSWLIKLVSCWKASSKRRIRTVMLAIPERISKIQIQKPLLILNPLPKTGVGGGRLETCHSRWCGRPVPTSCSLIGAA